MHSGDVSLYADPQNYSYYMFIKVIDLKMWKNGNEMKDDKWKFAEKKKKKLSNKWFCILRL